MVALGAAVIAAVAPIDSPAPDAVVAANESRRRGSTGERDQSRRNVSVVTSVFDGNGSDPFAVRPWVGVPSPVAVVTSAPIAPVTPQAPIFDMPQPPPAAPPLPYRFAGRLTDGAEQTFYLSRGDQLMVVKSGDTLESAYRIIGVDDRRIQFQHLPTGEVQVLTLPVAEN